MSSWTQTRLRLLSAPCGSGSSASGTWPSGTTCRRSSTCRIVYRVVALADPTQERREMGRDKAGLSEAQVYGDPLAMLARDDLDMVDLCTPQHVRRDLAIAAVESGRHLLSEKPIATTPADARRIVEAARAAGRPPRHHAQLPLLPGGASHAGAHRATVRSGRSRWRSWTGSGVRDNPGTPPTGHAGATTRAPRAAACSWTCCTSCTWRRRCSAGPSSGSPAGCMPATPGAPVEDIALARFEVEGGPPS